MRRVGLAVAATLALPGAASAADRYAAQDGSGTACTAAARCSLRQAVDGAVSGDQVLVAGGTYDLGDQALSTRSRAITLRGEVTGPRRPQVVIGADVVLAGASRAVDLGFRTTHGALRLQETATADRVSTRSDGFGCLLEGSATITNSLCVSDDPEIGGGGILADGGVSARGVTAVGRGPQQTGVTVLAGSDLTLTGVALAAGTGRKDLEVNGANTTVRTIAGVFDSASGIDGPGYTQTQRVTAAPVFVDEAALDYRPATASRTIDLDSTARTDRDLNGNLRTLGVRTDAGAYEFVASAPGLAVGELTTSTTTVAAKATVTTSGAAADVTAVLTPVAGGAAVSSAPVRVLPDDTSTPLAAQLQVAGLAPGSAYSLQVTVVTDGGQVTSAAQPVRTAAAPPTGDGGTGSGGGTTPGTTTPGTTTPGTTTPGTTTPGTTTPGGPATTPGTTTPGGTTVPGGTPAPGGTTTPPKPAALAVTLKRSGAGTLTRSALARSGLAVRVGCGAAACSLKLSGTVKAGGRRVGTLRSASTSVAPRGSRTVRLRAGAALRKALARRRTLTVSVTASARTAGGRTARRTLVLRAR